MKVFYPVTYNFLRNSVAFNLLSAYRTLEADLSLKSKFSISWETQRQHFIPFFAAFFSKASLADRSPQFPAFLSVTQDALEIFAIP